MGAAAQVAEGVGEEHVVEGEGTGQGVAAEGDGVVNGWGNAVGWGTIGDALPAEWGAQEEVFLGWGVHTAEPLAEGEGSWQQLNARQMPVSVHALRLFIFY